MRRNSTITITDQFCGAGGSSLGAVKAGAELKMALNHWKLAIETHNSNFPNADHDCTDISACNPRRYPTTDGLITSPECFPAGTLILTKRGLVPIEEIAIGDMVLTHLNRWRCVRTLMSSAKNTILLAGQGHRALELTSEHPVYTRSQRTNWDSTQKRYVRQLGSPEWTNAQLADGMRWATPSNVPELNLPEVRSGNNRSVEFTDAFWWMVGRWLGDGSVRIRPDQSSEITICCGKHEVDELEALHFAPRTGPHARRNEIHWRKREVRTSYLFETSHDGLARWLVEHFGKGAHGKTIPAWVLGMNVSWREQLLRGYVSADGSTNARYTQTHSVSKRLALGIRLLAVSLGFHASLGCYRHKGGTIEDRPFEPYDIWIVRWENNASQRTGVFEGNHGWTLIKSVQAGREQVIVYNLSVDEDESYVADGIVVHNCTNHSLANGKAKKNLRQLEMFKTTADDPAAERSRATMWDVPRFAEYHHYRFIVVENVVEARSWVMWEAWLQAMHLLGYLHQCVYVNSMHAHPTPQSRDRMYVVFWKKGNKKPNLNITPAAHCPKCSKDIQAVQSWKPGRSAGRYRKQYLYCCPTCATVVEPYYYAAANVIDWTLPALRIGDREKPLKEATIRRIQIGLDKFGAQPQYVANYTPGFTKPLTSPLGALTTADHHAWLMPFVMNTQFTHSKGNRSQGINQALPTQTAQQAHALIVPPFLTSYYGTNEGSSMTDAMPTMTTKDRHSVVVPPFVMSYYNRLSGLQAAVAGMDEALPTVPGRVTHYVVQPPFIVNMQSDNQPTAMHEPLRTVLTGGHKVLIEPKDAVKAEDCGFRMLEPHECQKAMAFPDDYKVLGAKRDRIKQLGNAVTPPVMEVLLERCIASLR